MSTEGEKKSINVVSGFKWSTIGTVVMMAVKLLRGLIIPKILSEASYGLFTSVALFTRYLQFSDFGARAYFSKKLPQLYLNGNIKQSQELSDQAYSFIVFSFAISAIYLTIIGFFISGTNAEFYQIALLILIPSTIFYKLREFFMTYALGIQQYRLGITVDILNNILSVTFVVFGIYYYGAIGGVLATAVTEFFLFMYIYKRVDLRAKLTFDFTLFKNIRGYLRLFFISIAETLNSTCDQWFVLWIFSSEGYGAYSLGLTFGWLMIAVSGIFITALQPKIMALAESDKVKSEQLLHNSILFYFLICLFLFPFASIFIDCLVRLFFHDKPAFQEGLKLFYLMTFSGIIKGAYAMLKQVFIAKDKENTYVILSIISIGIFALGYFLYKSLSLPFEYLSLIIGGMDFIVFSIFYAQVSNISVDKKRYFHNKIMLVVLFGVALLYQFIIIDFPFTNAYFIAQALMIAIISTAVGIIFFKRKAELFDFLGIQRK
ncbi:MAG: hypothetical protein NT150_15185 [Bacteroidetes bacterium]|nr:hypothetical protein [Bacteroidota bacterium]